MKTEPARPSTAAGRPFAPSPPSTANPSPGAQVREACALLQRMFDAAIAAAQPQLCLPPFLPNRDQLGTGKLIVIGAGKASAAMAQALEAHYRQTDPDLLARLQGLVVTRYGYGAACERIEILEAAHPVPDVAGLRAAQRMLERVQGLHAQDVVLCLISGGGSALLPLPAAGLDLADKQAINRALLNSGASIGEMNCVRRHLSAIKGGRLALACAPARVINLLMSDVPGDRPIDIASGPTVADPSTCADAIAILDRYRIPLPAPARAWLESGEGESVKPGDDHLQDVQTHLIAAPQRSLEAAARVGEAQGYAVHILGDALEGEARDVGKVLAAIALQVAERGQPFQAPCVLLSGGETTVSLGVPCAPSASSGSLPEDPRAGSPTAAATPPRGGRNVEFLLSLAIGLGGHPRIVALAGDTDGVDGSAEIAGALCTPDTLERAHALGLRPTVSLDRHDGHGFFEALGDNLVTGPTRTNVNDFRALLILPPDKSASRTGATSA